MDKRITSIKPCSTFSRLPRSFEFRNLMKASEHRSNLLYYLPVCLKGLLQPKYLKHYNLLSSSIYKLLTTKISTEDLNEVENNLNIFVQQYEELYGAENMTMNVHQLRHIVFCVENLGPLWTQSMFSFESNNATFSRYVIRNTDVTAQLSTRYMFERSIKKEVKTTTDFSEHLSERKTIKLNASEVDFFSSNNIYFEIKQSVQIYSVYKKGNQRFTSMNYSQGRDRENK